MNKIKTKGVTVVFNRYSRYRRNLIDVYKKTPPMATHMVAAVMSEFGQSKINGCINVIARKDCMDQVQYVLDEAPKLLKAMEDYTGLQYELPKLNLFAVPDFKRDAMGNWGLNTYRYEITPLIIHILL